MTGSRFRESEKTARKDCDICQFFLCAVTHKKLIEMKLNQQSKVWGSSFVIVPVTSPLFLPVVI